MHSSRQAEGREWSEGDGSGVEGRGGKGRAGQGRVPDCLGGLSRVGISSRSTRPWNGQPPSIGLSTQIRCLTGSASMTILLIQLLMTDIYCNKKCYMFIQVFGYVNHSRFAQNAQTIYIPAYPKPPV